MPMMLQERRFRPLLADENQHSRLFVLEAGVPGFEPGYLVLETRVLPLDDTPL